LYAKLLVFNRQKLYIGSINFDQRSRSLNTEIGVIIDSRELAEQADRSARVADVSRSKNSRGRSLSPECPIATFADQLRSRPSLSRHESGS
jgi:putative cardiolipin synthase